MLPTSSVSSFLVENPRATRQFSAVNCHGEAARRGKLKRLASCRLRVALREHATLGWLMLAREDVSSVGRPLARLSDSSSDDGSK
jgi:hypothetical protein